MISGIHHVRLAAPPGSEDALRAFHGGVLGLEEIPKPPALAARLRAAGHETRPDDPFPGHRRFCADDPVGNRLEFMQPSH